MRCSYARGMRLRWAMRCCPWQAEGPRFSSRARCPRSGKVRITRSGKGRITRSGKVGITASVLGRVDLVLEIWRASGFHQATWGQLAMISVGCLLLYLAIVRRFEPLLLVPIGFGGILANIPGAGVATGDGLLNLIYGVGIETGAFPLIIFMGVGALTDFRPLLANPKTLLLGAAAQFGIFGTLLAVLGLSAGGLMDFDVREAAAIAIIGGADGPTAIYVAGKLAPHLLGAIAIAAYSYMALVPLIQPPIVRALTSERERAVEMPQLREVGKAEAMLFPMLLLLLIALLLPAAAPLLGMFCFGNLMRECGVVERLADTTRNALINTVTIFLGLAVGAKLQADLFLRPSTLGILLLGLAAFAVGTASGVLMAKLMNRLSRTPVNPVIGAAGVSAVPMAARVANRMGLAANRQNHLLMHAMGPNVAGVIGSAAAAGILILFAN